MCLPSSGLRRALGDSLFFQHDRREVISQPPAPRKSRVGQKSRPGACLPPALLRCESRLRQRRSLQSSALSQRKNSHSAFFLIDDDQRPADQLCLMLSERRHNKSTHVRRKNVLPPNLDDARSARMTQGQHRSKIQIVRKYDVIVGRRPSHDHPVRRGGIADRRPSEQRPEPFCESKRHPSRRQRSCL